jgi:Flp pilus assembly protein TadD
MTFHKRLVLLPLSLVLFHAQSHAGLTCRSRLRVNAAIFSQTSQESADYKAKRQKAAELFNQGRRLEALPLLEELVRSNPKDDEMLVALAASLVDHAATLSDQDAAGKERLRARDLLDQAWKLGNTSTLGQNLAHLLKEMPANGSIKFSDNPGVDQIMQAGEAAFAHRDFDEAIKNYTRALELEPKNYTATLFIGNSYDRKNDFVNARDWYKRAMALDRNIETAYRYCADMMAKQGDMTGARAMLIQAAVAEPYNRIVWRELNAWATLNKTEINMIYIGQPAPKEQPAATAGADGKRALPDSGPAWSAYRAVRKDWQEGDAFRKHYPQEASYRHSLGEELEALTAAATIEEKLRNAKQAGDPSLDLLLKLRQASLIEAYVLFSLGDDGIAHDYAPYREKNRTKLEEYMDKFVVPK